MLLYTNIGPCSLFELTSHMNYYYYHNSSEDYIFNLDVNKEEEVKGIFDHHTPHDPEHLRLRRHDDSCSQKVPPHRKETT